MNITTISTVPILMAATSDPKPSEPLTCEQKLSKTSSELWSIKDDLKEHGLYTRNDLYETSGITLVVCLLLAAIYHILAPSRY